MRNRAVVWISSAAGAIAVFYLARAADVTEWLVLGVTFIGAMAGAAIGQVLTRRQ
jgi:hypothetical protein